MLLWVVVFLLSIISDINTRQNIEYNQRVLYTEFSEDSCSTEPTFQYVLRVSSFQYVNTTVDGNSPFLITLSFDTLCLFIFTTAQRL